MYLHLVKTLVAGALLITSCCLVTRSEAATITLGDPVALSTLLGSGGSNPSITVGDKSFDTFTYDVVGADMPTAANVNVIPIQDGDGNYGIRLQAGFIDMPGGGASDALVTFRVAVTNPEPWRIVDAHLAGNPNLLGAIGSASVTETFLFNNPGISDSLDISDNGGAKKLEDSIDFALPGYRVLFVQKDIQLLGVDAPATISLIDQTFSQVPEASAVALTLIGCVAIGLKRRRQESELRLAV